MRLAETTLNSATSAQSGLCTMTLIVMTSALYDHLLNGSYVMKEKKNIFLIQHYLYFKTPPPQARENLQYVLGIIFVFRDAFTPAAGNKHLFDVQK